MARPHQRAGFCVSGVWHGWEEVQGRAEVLKALSDAWRAEVDRGIANAASRDWRAPFGMIPRFNGLASPNEAMAKRQEAYNRAMTAELHRGWRPYFWLAAEAERA